MVEHKESKMPEYSSGCKQGLCKVEKEPRRAISDSFWASGGFVYTKGDI